MGFAKGFVAAVLCVAAAEAAQAAERHRLDIPAGRLGDSVTLLGRQAGISIGLSDPALAARRAPALRGRFTVDEALRRLLRDAGARHVMIDARTVRIVPAPVVARPPARARPAPSRPTQPQPRPAPAPPAAPPPPAPPFEILVTGSRIARPDLTSPSPLTLVDGEQVDLAGTQNLEELINDLPQIVAGSNRTSNNAGGHPFPTIDLRGLGPQRTLVLIDGQRLPASSVLGVVDISQVPIGLIERIDVVTGGATAVYGSDAIAGVVNFILKPDFDGVEIGGQSSIAEGGVGFTFSGQALWGRHFAGGRGNVTLFASYHQRDGVFQGRFENSRVAQALFLDPASNALHPVHGPEDIGAGWTPFFPGGSTIAPWGSAIDSPGNPFNQAALAAAFPQQFAPPPGCAPLPNLSFDDSGRLTPFFSGGLCAVPLRENGSSRFNFAPDNYLILPHHRFNGGLIARFDIDDRTRARFFGNFTDSGRTVHLAPTPAAQRDLLIDPRLAQFIPADLRFALSTRSDPDAPFQFTRRFSEAGPRIGRFSNQAYNLRLFLERSLGPEWRLTGNMGWGRSDLLTRQLGNISRPAVEQGVNGCVDPQLLPGCVPVNIFGPFTLTPAMVDFVRAETVDRGRFSQARAEIGLAGQVGRLPGGPIGLAGGFELRRDSGRSDPDPAKIRGEIIGFDTQVPVSGAIEVGELYGELRLPVLGGDGFPDLLAFEIGGRYSHFSTIGGLFNWKAAAEFAPAPWIRFRGAYNRALRAPAIFELFEAGDIGFASYADPCNANRPDRPTSFCAERAPAAGAPGFIQPTTELQVAALAQPDLREERGQTFTAGLVFAPSTFPLGRLTLTLDYYDITLTNRIQTLGAQFHVNQCYLRQNPDACARVLRDPATGQIRRVEISRTNSDLPVNVRGIDGGLSWTVPMADLFGPSAGSGQLRFTSSFNHTIEYSIGSEEIVDRIGILRPGAQIPRWSSFLSAGYEESGGTLQLRYVYKSGADQSHFFGPGFAVPRVPDLHQVELSLRVEVNDQIQLTGIVGNLLGWRPPATVSGTFEQANINTTFFSPHVLGREFAIQGRVRF